MAYNVNAQMVGRTSQNGLTMKMSLTVDGVTPLSGSVDFATTELVASVYGAVNVAIPDGFDGYMAWYTGTVGAAVDFTGVTLYAFNPVNEDTMPELAQGIPTATPTARQALMLIYMTLRNKVTQTATEFGIYNDAGTKIAKKAVSDDATTYTEDEMISGA